MAYPMQHMSAQIENHVTGQIVMLRSPKYKARALFTKPWCSIYANRIPESVLWHRFQWKACWYTNL